ncbi:MAG: formate dehydrogenase subunit gamma [Kiloniellales bacterium]
MRQGVTGTVSLPDQQAGVLIQSEGDNWRAWRNGPMSVYGGWLLLAICVVVAVFFGLRGRIRTEAGFSGRTVERFNFIERFTHWLTATSFIVLALTGLNVLYGRYVLKPVIGADAFSAVTLAGKYAHNYIAFPFMLGVVMMLVLWVRHNFPNRYDFIWLAKGGGMFMKGVHPPAKKFNAGQKIVFWVVILGGILVSLSGISLLFPFQIPMFAKTFELLNLVGFDLPTALTPMADMQLSQLWHGIVALVFIAIIIAHIYIGSLGMEGAFDAMGTGMVDENWAREHHNIWAAEVKGEPVGGGGGHGDD